MAQISKGDTFTNGEQVTGSRLNQLVDASSLLVGAITEQPAITANTLEATDAIIVSDAGVLKKAIIGDVIGSGIPVATSSITAQANKDVVVTSNDAVLVVGSTYVSADAITVTVTTAVAHGLSANQVVQISGAGTGYNGVFKITAVTSLTFTFVLPSYAGATITTTPTSCNYLVKATTRFVGHTAVSGNQYVGGAVVTPNLEVSTQALIKTANLETANVTGLITAATAPSAGGHLTNKTYVDGTFSKATNGYCVLPNGIIMQWATGVVGSGLQVINFPIPFPTAVFSIIVSTKAENSDANDNMFQEWSNTLTSVSIYDQTFGGAGNFANVPRVFAIGH